MRYLKHLHKARQDVGIQFLQYGLFNKEVDPTLRAKFLEVFEFGNWEDIDNTDELHRSRAMRENKVMSEGQFAMPEEIDDHNIHITEHTKYMLDINFEKIKAERPDIAQMIYEHLNMHKGNSSTTSPTSYDDANDGRRCEKSSSKRTSSTNKRSAGGKRKINCPIMLQRRNLCQIGLNKII